MFSGIFTPCDVKCLSVGLFFNAVDTSSRQGLVSYGACDPVGASWQITIENSQVHASIGAESLSVWVRRKQDSLMILHVTTADFFQTIFIHLKLELLTQFPAPNDEK